MKEFTPESALQFAEIDGDRIKRNLLLQIEKREILVTIVGNPVCIKSEYRSFKLAYEAMEFDLKRACAENRVSRIHSVQLTPLRVDMPNDWIRFIVNASIPQPSI